MADRNHHLHSLAAELKQRAGTYLQRLTVDIPSVYLSAEEGAKLKVRNGETIPLEIKAQRQPARGYNVVASKKGASKQGTSRKDSGFKKVVVCAHIDSKMGTPGALDNASGTTVLLLLAELLADYRGSLGVDIVAINGEDYYSAPGEIVYLSSM